MKIKEAAQYCGLTEKAIRLYEAKGLIHPKTEEKNGRTFREYDDETIRTLLTVGTLRRADFSMEQIGAMQESPEKIPEIFAAYREEVKENAERLSVLRRALEGLEPTVPITLTEFADRLALAMIPEEAVPALPNESSENEERPPIQFHFYVWDEEGTPEEKEEAYRRFLEKQARRERVETVVFALPRKIRDIWKWLWRPVNRLIRDEKGKIKKTVKLTAVFLVLCGMLMNGIVYANRRTEQVQTGCAYEIFFAMHDLVYTLRNTSATGEYTYGHSETVIRSLTAIEKMANIAEYIYCDDPYPFLLPQRGDFHDLIRAMGCTYAASHNGTAVASILYDGETSENEMQFIEALLADLEDVYAIMLAEDGLNRRYDLSYPKIRANLNSFMRRWGAWEWPSEVPWNLLNRY